MFCGVKMFSCYLHLVSQQVSVCECSDGGSKWHLALSTGVFKRQQKSHTRRSCRTTWWAPQSISWQCFSQLWTPSSGEWTDDRLSWQWAHAAVCSGREPRSRCGPAAAGREEDATESGRGSSARERQTLRSRWGSRTNTSSASLTCFSCCWTNPQIFTLHKSVHRC